MTSILELRQAKLVLGQLLKELEGSKDNTARLERMIDMKKEEIKKLERMNQ